MQQGLRYNIGKLRYDLVHPSAHEEMVKVLTKGSEKYAERNWELGMSWTSVIASLKRHLAAMERGEDYDSETGLLHAAHVACNAHFLTAYYDIAPQYDDRPHVYLKTKRIGLDIDGVLADFVKGFNKRFDFPEDKVTTHWNDPQIRNLFNTVKGELNFWYDLPVLTPPSEIPFEPCCYVTSRSIPAEITQKWLDDNGYPSAPLISLATDVSKIEAVKSQNVDVYVDDRIENFVELNQAGVCCYLFDASYNRRLDVGHKRIKSLKELV